MSCFRCSVESQFYYGSECPTACVYRDVFCDCVHLLKDILAQGEKADQLHIECDKLEKLCKFLQECLDEVSAHTRVRSCHLHIVAMYLYMNIGIAITCTQMLSHSYLSSYHIHTWLFLAICVATYVH